MNGLKSITQNVFRSRRLKYGSNAVIFTAVIIAALVFLNLIIGQFSLKWDLTENRMFSFSEQTEQILKDLDEDVNIIGLYRQGQESGTIQQMLQMYAARSNKISFEFTDPYKDPGFVKRFDKDDTGLREGSVIVESGDKFRVISPFQLVNYNMQTGQAESLAVEQSVTSAIMYVTSGQQSKVYVLQGHGETNINTLQVKSQMDNENYLIENLDLVTTDEIPEDADILLVVSPKRDLSQGEADKLVDYLENGGRAVFLFDVVNDELVNFKEVLEGIGIKLNDDFVVEGDSSRHIGNPLWIAPKLASHDITNKLSSANLHAVLPGSRSIEIMERRRRSLDIEQILVSSDNSWGKTDMNTTTFEKEDGDLEGPLTIGAAIHDKRYRDGIPDMKVVVVGNASFIGNNYSGISGNSDFFMNSLNWLEDRQERITIRPKSLAMQRLNLTWIQAVVSSVIVIGVIPLLIMISGLVIWLRRRHL